MYIRPGDREHLERIGILPRDAKCLECDRQPDIIWHGQYVILFLCSEHAQYIGTHLIKDVRDFERTTGISVKVRTERVATGQLSLDELFRRFGIE